MLTAREVSWRHLRGARSPPGSSTSCCKLAAATTSGHTLKHAGNVYGTFGLVIGLLSWIYLSSQITLLAAEGNVVATRGL